MPRRIQYVLLALVIAGIIHADFHVARPTHHRLSLGLSYHWVFAAIAFFIVGWVISRLWPDKPWRAAAGITALGLLLGQGVEPVLEYATYSGGLGYATEPSRWTAFLACIAAGIPALIIGILASRSRRRATLLAMLTVGLAAPARGGAQTVWHPSAGHTQIPIWPGAIPNARRDIKHEIAGTVIDSLGRPKLVGGKPWIYVDSVSQPTMTVYSPVGKNTGAAVVVFPGGGYNVLAIDLEGSETCDWLTSKGITCVLLKYRVPCVKTGPYRDCLTALQDAQRTVGLVRSRAAQWKIDPHRIGVIGYSAGGHMVVALSTHFEKRLYPRVDAADDVSCRPDFAIALYPGHIAVAEKKFAMNPDLRVTSRTPPTFLLQAENDPVDPVENSIVYHDALRRAGVPVELHLFVKGGHAFALRPSGFPVTEWPVLAEKWLATIGMIPK